MGYKRKNDRLKWTNISVIHKIDTIDTSKEENGTTKKSLPLIGSGLTRNNRTLLPLPIMIAIDRLRETGW